MNRRLRFSVRVSWAYKDDTGTIWGRGPQTLHFIARDTSHARAQATAAIQGRPGYNQGSLQIWAVNCDGPEVPAFERV